MPPVQSIYPGAEKRKEQWLEYPATARIFRDSTVTGSKSACELDNEEFEARCVCVCVSWRGAESAETVNAALI